MSLLDRHQGEVTQVDERFTRLARRPHRYNAGSGGEFDIPDREVDEIAPV